VHDSGVRKVGKNGEKPDEKMDICDSLFTHYSQELVNYIFKHEVTKTLRNTKVRKCIT
jgi:hypothetical protein